MKFDKSKGKDANDSFDDKESIREKIWQNPSIVNKLFADDDWQQFDANKETAEIPAAEMLAQINDGIRNAEEQKAKQRKKQYNLKLWAYGTAAAIALVFSFSLLLKQDSKVAFELAYAKNPIVPIIDHDTVWATISNPSNVIKKVKLPDNSTVGLFANSSIRYREKFTKVAREIHLNGKAYFSVKKDASRPFSVYAGGTKTTALGTSFTINTRSTQHKTDIKLHTGKIVIVPVKKVASFARVFLSQKGESLSFNSYSNSVERIKVIKPELLAKATKPAKPKLLNLNNIPLNEVFAAMQEAYGIKIQISNTAIANIQYTGSIDIEKETITDALAVICLINELRYVVEKDGSYTIYTQQ
ncbi:MAG: FecR family protein [Flavobacteriales bacterium]|nr:MAG: FecR family protein [Flavobacteriales bacterium]